MIDNAYPTRAEVNDIYNALEMGASGLVLAAETAIGKYPKECVELLFKIINVYKKIIKMLKKILIIGLPGSGKTTLAKELKKKLKQIGLMQIILEKNIMIGTFQKKE